ncbi:MAG: YggT family protein [Treponema sp.]|nr:YggT family protein [Treponema sp.]
MLQLILKTVSGAISIYTMLCFIRIILSWFPGALYTGFGRFISSICDPYINLFRAIPFLRLGMIDFTPTLAILVLMGLSMIVGQISITGKLTVASILIFLFSHVIWSLISAILGFVIFIFVIRLIILFIYKKNGNYPGSIWDSIDRAISPFIFRISGTFIRKPTSFKTSLIISIIALVIMYFGIEMLISLIINLLKFIPF